MVHGVIVLAPPVAALPEIYEDYVLFVSGRRHQRNRYRDIIAGINTSNTAAAATDATDATDATIATDTAISQVPLPESVPPLKYTVHGALPNRDPAYSRLDTLGSP